MENFMSVLGNFIGTIGTFLVNYDGIIGTLLGMFFSYFIQSRGKLKIFIKKSYGEFYYDDMGDISTSRNANSTLEYFLYHIELYLYNTSSDFKSIRDLKLSVFSDNKIVKTENLKDESTRTYNGISYAKDADIYNIPPKNVEVLNLSFYISDDDLKNINYNNAFFELEYTNSKNKRKTIKVFKDIIKEPKISTEIL
mgnify:CR=1 FL=1